MFGVCQDCRDGKSVPKPTEFVTEETRHESITELRQSGTTSHRRQLVLDTIGNAAMTAHEILTAMLSAGVVDYYDPNFVRPRLTELKELGLVETVGKRKCERTGKNVAIWRSVHDES
jgi:hypothetical protein